MIEKINYYVEYDTGKKVHDKYGIFTKFNNTEHLGFCICKLYDDKWSLSLADFFSKTIPEEVCKTLKNNREKQFEITLDYLSDLLRKGKLKMKTFEQVRKDDEEGLDGYVMDSVYPGKEWEHSNIEEGIKYVRDKWFSLEDERMRESYQDWGFMFTLPENEWMM